MNILSKQLLYVPSSTPTIPPSYTYEAYYVFNGTATLLGNVSDLSKTFAAQDEFIYSNVFVFDGDLYNNGTKVTTGRNITSLTGRSTSSSYYGFFVDDGKLFRYNSSMNIAQIGSATDWIKVCGYTSTSSSGVYRSFGEASDGLWIINQSSASRISTLTGWTKITGYGSTSSANYYGYGINDGKLYYLYANGNGVVQQGTDTTWTDITGSYENGSWYGYGINNGKLYRLSGTPTQVGSATNWTDISGTSSTSSSAYCLGINGGKLYKINGTTASQIGSATDWESCSGFCRSGIYGLATASDGLYDVTSNDGRTRLSASTDWVYVGENYSTSAYAVAIRRVQQ